MHNVRNHPGPAPRPQRNEYHVQHDPDGVADLTTTVVHALSDVMGRDVTDAGFVLYDCIDPDALDRIFDPLADDESGPAAHLAFVVEGYQVTVYSTGQIVITPPSGSPR